MNVFTADIEQSSGIATSVLRISDTTATEVHVCHCTHCGADIEYRISLEEDEDEL